MKHCTTLAILLLACTACGTDDDEPELFIPLMVKNSPVEGGGRFRLTNSPEEFPDELTNEEITKAAQLLCEMTGRDPDETTGRYDTSMLWQFEQHIADHQAISHAIKQTLAKRQKQ